MRRKLADCIILAGGLGTRLRPVVSDVPKPLAVINDRPFLEWQLEYLARQGIRKVVLCVGYKREFIISHFGSEFLDMSIEYSIEKYPLGTGGAILNALEKIDTEAFYVLNGDTFFPINCDEMMDDYMNNECPSILLAVFSANKDKQYGALSICPRTKQLLGIFSSKAKVGDYSNGGVYLCNKELWLKFSKTQTRNLKLSLEDDLIPNMLKNGFKLFTKVFSDELIDIGTPEDYQRAQKIFRYT